MKDPGKDPEHEPDFDDPAYDDLRALLADARVTEPVPADVAARLAETLAELTADRRTAVPEEAAAAVVPLRRRSRVGSRLLVAAAAVLVVGGAGIGLATLLDQQDASLTTAGAAADSATDNSTDGAGTAAPEAPVPESAPLELDSTAGPATRVAALPRFSSVGFAREAAAFDVTATRLSALSGGFAATSSDTTAPKSYADSEKRGPASAYDAARAACPGPVDVEAILLPITFDGSSAALALYPATADGQRFEAWSCDGSTVLASTVVPR